MPPEGRDTSIHTLCPNRGSIHVDLSSARNLREKSPIRLLHSHTICSTATEKPSTCLFRFCFRTQLWTPTPDHVLYLLYIAHARVGQVVIVAWSVHRGRVITSVTSGVPVWWSHDCHMVVQYVYVRGCSWGCNLEACGDMASVTRWD